MRIAAVVLGVAAVAAIAAVAVLVSRRAPEGVRGEPVPDDVPAARPPPALGLRGRGALVRADLAPTRDPTPLAAEFLLACQGDDGFFHAARGVREGDPAAGPEHDAALTGLAVLVLLDAADPTGDAREAKAVRAALDAVARRPAGRPAGEGDLEGHALLTWALAAGYAHTDEARWRSRVAPAVERLAFAAHEDGGWRSPTGRPDDHLLLSMWAAGALHEALTLTRTVPDADPLLYALEAAGAWAGRMDDEEAARRSPGARCAWALLLRGTDRRAEPIRPEEALRPVPPSGAGEAFSCDHAAVLWGTVHRFLGGDLVAWRTWETGAVLPALARQRLDDPGRGSWDPADDLSRRRGRAWSTAVEAMAWLVIRVEWKPPRGT